MPDAVDRLNHPRLKLGRRPPSNRPALSLANLLTGKIPAHPVLADHFTQVKDFGLYANDQFGDCGPVSVANDLKLVSRYLGDAEVSVGQEDVFDLYKRSGNPQFNPNDPGGPGDGGVDMNIMLTELSHGGIGGYKPVAFAKVDASNLDEVRAAISIFGSCLFGVDLQQAQQGQTGSGLWDYQQSAEWGGHAILAGLYTSRAQGSDISVVTWAKVVGTTDAFCAKQLQECWVVVWPEHFGSKAFQEGVNVQALADAYKALTGKALPVPITPPPGPTPPPNPKPGPNPNPPPPPPWEVAVRELVDRLHRTMNAAQKSLAELEAFLSKVGR